MGSILRQENKAKEYMEKQDKILESLRGSNLGTRPKTASHARSNLSKGSSLSIKRSEPIGNIQLEKSGRSNASQVSRQTSMTKKSDLSIKIDNALGT